MKILRIEHVAIATESLTSAAPFWREVLEIPHQSTETVESEGVSVDIYDTGGGRIELLARYGEDSPVTNFLKKRGPGLHHICLEVDDIDRAARELKEKGIRLLSEGPLTGSQNYRYLFIHPDSTGGVLLELSQHS